MPIYEFECEQCGNGFDDLVAVGTEHAECPECGSQQTKRRYSAPMSTFKLVKTPGAARQQEARNRKLHADTKSQFKARRQRARDAAKAKKQGGGA